MISPGLGLFGSGINKFGLCSTNCLPLVNFIPAVISALATVLGLSNTALEEPNAFDEILVFLVVIFYSLIPIALNTYSPKAAASIANLSSSLNSVYGAVIGA